MRRMKRLQQLASAVILTAVMAVVSAGSAAAQGKPEGEMRFALYVTMPPAWLDPGEAAPGFTSPFWVLYGLHDAVVKPMPDNSFSPGLAESWSVSQDALTYEFVLRKGSNSTMVSRLRQRTSNSPSSGIAALPTT